ncbi:response regulator [Paenibacillus sp. FSL H8-0537]|uniref:response regulator n=1 Tax=Paenibacillus sp. FSL H8-0537 TaxID=2921399 RepID=UPI0031012EB5
MKTILVDNEPLTLKLLEEELGKIGGIDIVGIFSNPELAYQHILADPPIALFLDIDTQELGSIQLAEQVLQHFPEVMLIFLTEQEKYAVKAFELSAHDYIMKPFNHERLCTTVERLLKRARIAPPAAQLVSGPAKMIHCFRSLRIGPKGDESVTLKWKILKAQELFAYLLEHRGKLNRKEDLLDQLWPEIEWRKGTSQLYTAIYQIRRMMHREGVDIRIVNRDEGYTLDLNGVLLDTEEWERKIKRIPPLTDETLEQHQQMLEMYPGDYLLEYAYEWAETERRRLRTLWLRHAQRIAQHYDSIGNEAKAVQQYLLIQKQLPSEEQIYFELMRLYDRMNERFAVQRQYDQLIQMLRQEFDAEPLTLVQQWYNQWQYKHSQRLSAQ